MNSLVLALAAIVVLGLVALLIHLLLTIFNRRGWVYYRNPDTPKGSSLGLLEEIYQPSTTHVVDQQILDESHRDQTESGDSEHPGRSDHDNA